MRDRDNIATTLLENEGSQQGPIGRPEPGPDEVKANQTVAAWFDAALKCVPGTEDSRAAELGVDRSYMGRMRKGKKSVPLRHLLYFKGNLKATLEIVRPLIAEFVGDREAILAIVEPLLKSIDYMAMPRPQMSKRRAVETIAAVVRRNPTLRRAARDELRDAGLDPDDVEAASDFGPESTGTDLLAGVK